MGTWRIIQADVLDWLDTANRFGLLQGYFHACFSDWPYNLESIRKRFGGQSAMPAGFGRDGAFQRQSRGFMNADWDTPLAYDPATWEAIKPMLRPESITASFTHPRKQDLLVHAQRQAGYLVDSAFYNYHSGSFVNLPQQLGWIYGSGKPNGTRVDLYLDPETDQAEIWNGWQYGSPIAPEIEPIIIAMNPPRIKKSIQNITGSGAGAYNIAFGQQHKVSGRFPGNLILTHHPGCKFTGQKAIKNGSGSLSGNEPSVPMRKHTYDGGAKRTSYHARGDENGVEYVPAYDCHPDCKITEMEAQAGGDKAHYFYHADWNYEVMERLAMANPIFYSGKVHSKERNAGLDDFPLLVRSRVNPGGLQREPRFADTLQENNHPTLKPIKLCRWIAGLLLPPPEYAPRRILVPTAGTGSEMIGCLLAGWDEVIGIELENSEQRPYADIARARLRFWSSFLHWGQTDVDAILSSINTNEKMAGVKQMGLFDAH